MMKPNKTLIHYNLPLSALWTMVLLMSTAECVKQEHVCGSIDIRNEVGQFEQLEHCTVIEGNLQILLIDFARTGDYDLLSFPKLVEITGHFLMFRVKGLTTFVHIFPNLAIIRGQHLFHNYALVAFEMQDLRELGLPGLVTIQRGGVRIEKNPNLCYIDTVNFDLLLAPQTENYIRDNKHQSECANVCPSTASRPNMCRQWTWLKTHETICWTSSHCQIACDPLCGDNCHRVGQDCSCHRECIAGCTGPSAEDCIACRHLFHNGTCVGSCPPGTYLFLNRRCITRDECPNGWKLMDSQCLEECPLLYKNASDPRLCERCDGPCPKVCPGMTVNSLGAAEKLHGCTVINGSLSINIHGGSNVVAELEENLKMVEEVYHYVEISHSFPLVSLNFLKSLRRIHGQQLLRGYAIYVLDNQNLQHLFDWDTHMNLTVAKGKAFFHFNPKLCLSKIREFQTRVNLTENHDVLDISVTTNGDQVGCETTRLYVYTKPQQESIWLRWPPYVIDDERDLLSYQVSWRVAPERNVTEFDGQDACGSSVWNVEDVPPDYQSTILTHLEPWTQYAILVKTYTIAESDKGAKSDIIYVRTEEDTPTPPTNLLAVAKSSSELQLLWDPPSKPNGNVTHYEVVVWEQKEDVELFDLRDYCVEGFKLPTNEREEDSQDPGDKASNFTDGCCACPKDEKQLKIEEDEAQLKKDFENFLHNSVYIPRPIDPNEYERLRRDSESGRAKSNFREHITTRRTLRDISHSPQNNLSAPVGENTAAPPEGADSVNATSQPNVTPKAEDAPYFATVVYFRRDFKLSDLRHFTKYSIEVNACNRYSCGRIAVATARTLPDATADVIPGNVSVIVMNNITHPRQVLVTWREPVDPNGVVIFHEIAYMLLEESEIKDDVPETVEATVTSDEEAKTAPQQGPPETIECIPHKQYRSQGGHILKGLAAGNYSVRVRTSSLAGNGTWSAGVIFAMPEEPVPTQAPGVKSDYSNLIPIIGGCVAVFLVIIGVIAAVLYKVFKKRYMNNGLPNGVLYASYNPEYMSAGDMYVPDEWEVPREKITLLRELGQGSFGMVYEGEGKDIHEGEGKTKVAIKTVNENASIRDRIEFLNEASVMKAFNCNHVVRLLGVVSKGQPTLVVMELMAQGDLKNWLRSHRPDEPDNEGRQPPTVAHILQMAGEIADGMAYLAAQKFVHRDLAARNCMVATDGTVKIGDFGMTRDIYETDYYRKGGKGLLPVRWMAPESLKDGVFTSLSDVWSYGVVMWEMATLAEQPYQGLTNEQVLKYVIDGNSLDKPTGCPERLFTLMTTCWQYNPKMRPSFVDLIENMEIKKELTPQFKEVAFFYSDERHRIKESHKMEEAVPLMYNLEPEFDHGNPQAQTAVPEKSVEASQATAPVDYSHVPKNGILNGVAVKVPKCTTC